MSKKEPVSGDWRKIPGYGGKYEVSREGQVRRTYQKAPPRTMTLRQRKRNQYTVGLRDLEGNRKEHIVSRLVAEAYIRPLKDGEGVYHKNRIKSDNHVGNLVIMKRSELARATAYQARAHPSRGSDGTARS